MEKAVILLCFVSFASSHVLQELDDFPVVEGDLHIYFHSRNLTNGMEISHKNFLEDMSQTDFNASRKTFFLIHGWHNDYSSKFCVGLTEAYLPKYDVNVFKLDYREVAKMDYYEAVTVIQKVAECFGKLIKALVKYHDLDLNESTIVGHSLGAQIAGLTGALLDGKIDTIIGLDPAGPTFLQNNTAHRLNEADAKFVMAVHTAISSYGEAYPLADADYYANQGFFQPGCPHDTLDDLICDHTRSYFYFIESINGGPFKALKCESYEKFKSGACANNSVSNMGRFDIDKSASGTYFFETNASPPFSKS